MFNKRDKTRRTIVANDLSYSPTRISVTTNKGLDNETFKAEINLINNAF